MTVEDKITEIVNLAQPDTRKRLEQALRACSFTSIEDPSLHAIYVQAILAAQPIRMVTDHGVGVATAEDMARLGDCVNGVLWSILRLKWHLVLVAFVLFSLAGFGTALVAFKMWPESLAPFFNLPKLAVPVKDSRITALENVGSDFVVRTDPNGITYLYFKGNVQPKGARGDDGRNYLYFAP